MNTLVLILLGILIVHYLFGLLGGRYIAGGIFGLIAAVSIIILGVLGTFAFVYLGYKMEINHTWLMIGIGFSLANLILSIIVSIGKRNEDWILWVLPLSFLEWATRIGILAYLMFLFGFQVNWWH